MCKAPSVEGARGECHQSNSRGKLAWSGDVAKEDPTISVEQLGIISAWLKKRRRASSPKRPRIESAKESASA